MFKIFGWKTLYNSRIANPASVFDEIENINKNSRILFD